MNREISQAAAGPAEQDAAKLVRGGPAASRIYGDLRRRIIDLELKPDMTLSRNELAQSYGVSLTPVREALQLLEQDGLVRIHPQSKTVVARISQDQLHETQFMRVALETEVVRRLASNPNEAVVNRARSIIKMQQTLVDNPSEIAMFNELDRAFHAGLFEGVGMYGLHAHLLRRLGHLARCQRLELPRAGKMTEIVQAHTEIVDGLAAQDPERATDAMRRHITGTITRVSALQLEFPDFFERAST